jgi:aminoglycoside/choline kinase family phosphotransferase
MSARVPDTALKALRRLFQAWCGQEAGHLQWLPAAGSNRRYARISSTSGSHLAIGTWNPNPRENKAFLYLSEHFHGKGIPVPAVYGADEAAQVYLQQDLGPKALYELLPAPGEDFDEALKTQYQHVLRELAALHVQGARDIDLEQLLTPRIFNAQGMLWDLQYFKYYYLKLFDIPFDEAALERDFERLCTWLGQEPATYLNLRDCQSRNILLPAGKPYFIDYQGARLGPAAYDVVSLLWQARARIPYPLREELREYYLTALLNEDPEADLDRIRKTWSGFVLLRCLQVLAVYGLRGRVEGKSHFLASIPPALDNLRYLLDHERPELPLPELWACLEAVLDTGSPLHTLRVHLQSFSYKKGLPQDASGHGGGHMFDCRAIDNPGRYETYKALSGLDAPVRQFLDEQADMQRFLRQTEQIVLLSVHNYLERRFEHLQVSYGCTGGQHRSVYAAERLAERLRQIPGVQVELEHREASAWRLC